MLTRSFSSALKGKGKARLSFSSVNGASTPSTLPQAGPSRAAYSTRVLESTRSSCTCRNPSPAYVRLQTRQPAAMQKARLHATALQRQKSIPEVAELSMREYHELADQTMDQLTDTLEAVQEELGEDDFDVEYSSGVLTVKLPADKGTYVINKQPPNKQIWLSSPKSGPKRYDYSKNDEHWFYTRDGSFLINLLEEELTEKLGTKVSFDALHQ